MNDRHNDISAIILVTVLAMIGAVLFLNPVVRTIAGLPLIFYLPGHAVMRATGREWRNDMETVVLASGLSIAVTIFCGLVLNVIGPLTSTRWAFMLGTVTLVACCVAHMRGRSRPPISSPAPVKLPALSINQALMLTCSVTIAIAVAVWSRQDALAYREFAYTELWMMPDARGGALTIGVRNAERTPSSYDLELTFDDRIVAVRRSIELPVGESWVSNFAVPARDGETHRAEVRLFKGGNDRVVYRRVWQSVGSQELRP